MSYVPNAQDPSEPVESRSVESAALEFRTLKAASASYLRVPEDSVSLAPAVADRAGKVLGFDASGSPVAVAVSGASDPSLRADLAASAGSSLVGFLQAGTGAVATNVQAKLRESVSVLDFMTAAQIADVQAGTAAVDVSAAIQAAVSYAVANDKSVLIPAGEYRLTAPISITSQVTVFGRGTAVSRLLCVNTDAFNISAGVGFVNISGMTIAHAVRYTTTTNTSTAINILGTTGSQCYWHTYADLFIDGFAQGFFAGGVCSSTWHNVTTVYTYKSVTFSAQCLNNAISQCRFGERDSGSIVPTAGSFGIKVGDGAINCEGLIISDTLVFGVRRALWVRASINVVAHHNIFDMVHEFGILAESTDSAV